MTDTITVDLDRARELLREVCEANPTKIDTSNLYFDPNNHECLCVVGAVIEKLGKGYEDMGIVSAVSWTDEPNRVDFTGITVDGVEFTSEAILYLDEARMFNDNVRPWGEIPGLVEQEDLIADLIR